MLTQEEKAALYKKAFAIVAEIEMHIAGDALAESTLTEQDRLNMAAINKVKDKAKKRMETISAPTKSSTTAQTNDCEVVDKLISDARTLIAGLKTKYKSYFGNQSILSQTELASLQAIESLYQQNITANTCTDAAKNALLLEIFVTKTDSITNWISQTPIRVAALMKYLVTIRNVYLEYEKKIGDASYLLARLNGLLGAVRDELVSLEAGGYSNEVAQFKEEIAVAESVISGTLPTGQITKAVQLNADSIPLRIRITTYHQTAFPAIIKDGNDVKNKTHFTDGKKLLSDLALWEKDYRAIDTVLKNYLDLDTDSLFFLTESTDITNLLDTAFTNTSLKTTNDLVALAKANPPLTIMNKRLEAMAMMYYEKNLKGKYSDASEDELKKVAMDAYLQTDTASIEIPSLSANIKNMQKKGDEYRKIAKECIKQQEKFMNDLQGILAGVSFLTETATQFVRNGHIANGGLGCGTDGTFTIQSHPTDLSVLAHELVHLRQVKEGKLGFINGKILTWLYDIEDECEAYQVQFAMNPNNVGIETLSKVDSVSISAMSAYSNVATGQYQANMTLENLQKHPTGGQNLLSDLKLTLVQFETVKTLTLKDFLESTSVGTVPNADGLQNGKILGIKILNF